MRRESAARANDNGRASRRQLLLRRSPRIGLLKIIPTSDDIVHENAGGFDRKRISVIACCVTSVRSMLNTIYGYNTPTIIEGFNSREFQLGTPVFFKTTSFRLHNIMNGPA